MYVYTYISGIICIIQLYHSNVNIHYYIYTLYKYKYKYKYEYIYIYIHTRNIFTYLRMYSYVHIKSTQQMKQPTHKRLFDQRTNMFGFKQPI